MYNFGYKETLEFRNRLDLRGLYKQFEKLQDFNAFKMENFRNSDFLSEFSTNNISEGRPDFWVITWGRTDDY